MPEEVKRRAAAIAKRRHYGKERTRAYEYGAMRDTGWIPSTQKKRGASMARRKSISIFGRLFSRKRRTSRIAHMGRTRTLRRVEHIHHVRRAVLGARGRRRMTEEERRAKARHYYQTHKAEIAAKRRAKYTPHPRARRSESINAYGGPKGRKRGYGITGGRVGPAALGFVPVRTPRRNTSRTYGILGGRIGPRRH